MKIKICKDPAINSSPKGYSFSFHQLRIQIGTSKILNNYIYTHKKRTESKTKNKYLKSISHLKLNILKINRKIDISNIKKDFLIIKFCSGASGKL